MDRLISLLLCGDVMLGRGVDQILARPGDPTLVEDYVRDARRYVDQAETAHGRVPQPVEDTWPWGAALEEIERSRPGVLVINLETSVTGSSDFAPRKAVHYRMSPDNIGALLVVKPDVCVLANNHVMDFGSLGLLETLRTLHDAGLAGVGAGKDRDEAAAPATVAREGGPDVSVLACAHPSSGVPGAWAASTDGPGVAILTDLSGRAATSLARRVEREKQRGAVVVLSVHWGSNWGYDVPRKQVRFAHRMIDAGVDVVHGHSSHHPRPAEVFAGRLVLYGCGDFVNDYEGISGFEQYRDDLRLLYRLGLARDGALVSAELVPFRSRRLRLERAGAAEAEWLAAVLDRQSRPYGVRVRRTGEDALSLGWATRPGPSA